MGGFCMRYVESNARHAWAGRYPDAKAVDPLNIMPWQGSICPM